MSAGCLAVALQYRPHLNLRLYTISIGDRQKWMYLEQECFHLQLPIYTSFYALVCTPIAETPVKNIRYMQSLDILCIVCVHFLRHLVIISPVLLVFLLF